MEKSYIYTGEELTINCRVLVLNYKHHTMDMSVANSSERTRAIIIPDDAKFPIKSEDWCACGPTTIVGIKEDDSIVLKWRGMEYVLAMGEMCDTTTVYLENPYLSREEVSMSYEYCEIDAMNGVLAYYNDIREQQDGNPRVSTYIQDDKDLVLQLLWYIIEKGYKGFYPTYALLKSCNNWASQTITDVNTFTATMRAGIKAGCFAPEYTNAVDNLAELLQFNKTEEVFGYLPELQGIMQQLGEAGNEMAQIIASGDVLCYEKQPRQDPELRHKTLALYYWDEHEADHGYWLFVDDEIRPGATADMGEMGIFKIEDVKGNVIEYTWDGNKYTLEDEYERETAADDVHELVLKYREQNLWTLLKNKISHVGYGQISSNPNNKHDIEETKAAVIKLTERLIAGGDKDLTALLEALKTNEDWTCFDYGGELRYLLE